MDCKPQIIVAEDEDYPDGRIAAQNEHAIEHRLEQAKIIQPELRYELEENIKWVNDN
jgi:hypothetical protein